MNVIATILFPIGVVAMAIAFAAHVGHAVLLANGRRSLAMAFNRSSSQPAWAGAVSGSFADARAASAGADPATTPLGLAPTPLGRAAAWVSIVGFAALAGYLVIRGVLVGRGPWGNMFEFTVAFATSITGGYLFLSRRYPIRSIGFIPTGVSLALQNPPLITIHVGLAVLSYGIFATSFAAGVAFLIQGTEDRFGWLPGHKVLDEVAYRSVIIGFPIFATMIILGSWWASIAWSRYWGWDPKETAALITWLSYAVYLHARNQKSWAGRPAALLLVVAFGMVIVTYSGSLWFNGLHSYSGL